MAGSGRWRHPKSWSKAKTQLPGKLWWVGEGGDSHMPGKRESSWGWVQLRERVTECNWAEVAESRICPALHFLRLECSAFPCVIKKWNRRMMSVLIYSSTPFPYLQVEEESFWNELFPHNQNNLKTSENFSQSWLCCCYQQKSKSPRNSSVCWSRKLLFWTEI